MLADSAVVKCSKLTVATPVYRGMTGKALPERFWEADEFGVRGGVEVRHRGKTQAFHHTLAEWPLLRTGPHANCGRRSTHWCRGEREHGTPLDPT